MSNILIDSDFDKVVKTEPDFKCNLNQNISASKDFDEQPPLDFDVDFLINKEKLKENVDVGETKPDESVPPPSPPTPTPVETPKMEPLNPNPPPVFQPPTLESVLSSSFFSPKKEMTEEEIRKEKSFLLHQYNTKNGNYRYSAKSLSMNNSLEEVKNELEYINSRKDMENNLGTWKNTMFMAFNGLVYANSTFDPFDVDLSDWLKDIHYDLMSEGKYDEALEELIHKWRGKMPIGPEWKIAWLIGLSLGGNILSQKQNKREKERARLHEEMVQKNIQEQVQKQMQEMYQKQQFYNPSPQQPQTQPHIPPQQHQTQPQPQPHIPTLPTQRPQHTQQSAFPEPKLNGPSLSDEDIFKLVQENLAEEADDDMSVASIKKEKKSRGRPKKVVTTEL